MNLSNASLSYSYDWGNVSSSTSSTIYTQDLYFDKYLDSSTNPPHYKPVVAKMPDIFIEEARPKPKTRDEENMAWLEDRVDEICALWDEVW